MTNKELLEIIKIAKENSINVDTIKRVFTLMEQDGEISYKKVNQIKELFQEKGINDDELLVILENAYQKKINEHTILALNRHVLIKHALSKMNLNKKEWKLILDFVYLLPSDIVVDSIYVKWLRYICDQKYFNLDELNLYHQIFKESINTPCIYYNLHFKYLLDGSKPLNNRENILKLLKQNIMNMLKENVEIKEIEMKIKKITKCYELYGYKLTGKYATIITCIFDIDIPLITNDLEMQVYNNLYTSLCYVCTGDNLGHNFINSYYYKLATNKEIAPEKRLEFTSIMLYSKNLILKDEWVYNLWKIYEEKDQAFLKELKYAFSNKGIRTNILCKSFLLNEPDLTVIKLARRTFRNNRVRKDNENLCILNDLKGKDEKLEFLQFLEEKYQDDLEVKRKEKLSRQAKEEALLRAYKDFLNKKIGLTKLEESLKDSEDLEISIVRTRVNKNE